ncbi:LSU ribosomal protein L29P [Hydrogenivirga caldilitoris]|uniref:Large ribosomal subunit protein uL29 n=1 Tax=Hydrogenivirga caldilitoris TaxID=246264 RepID=A0A497XLL1_9AQUI|nr:50S ribosomal protein L29 [Hydrogenivirga caldilitoris]RLJ69756.1 LSU ribosomal protein L29P [Hydrogenivirga caldilitoris]
MKAAELRKLKKEELEKKVDELKTELLRLKFQQKISGLDNPMAIKNLRREIARALTIIREKELRGE